jgi:hypothetical protein
MLTQAPAYSAWFEQSQAVSISDWISRTGLDSPKDCRRSPPVISDDTILWSTAKLIAAIAANTIDIAHAENVARR